MTGPLDRSVGRVHGKVALVTGAGSGIGAATARALAREGATVAVTDLDGDSACRVADEINTGGGHAVGLQLDVSRADDVAAVVDDVVGRLGRLDVLHNNAAAMGNSRDGVVHLLDLENWEMVLRTNLTGAMVACRQAIPTMIAHGGGSIINTASASSLAGEDGRSAYGATKAGLNALTRSIATQYGKQGIRCNSIAPGLILTPAARRQSDEALRVWLDHHLTPYLGEPDDVAMTALFLASDESRFITGQVLCVDGGLLSYEPVVPALRAMAAGA